METILNQSDIGSNLSEYIFWSFIIVLCGSWLHCPLVPLTRNVSCLLIFFLIIIMLLFPFAIAFTPNLSASSLIFSSFPLRVGFSHVWNLLLCLAVMFWDTGILVEIRGLWFSFDQKASKLRGGSVSDLPH